MRGTARNAVLTLALCGCNLEFTGPANSKKKTPDTPVVTDAVDDASVFESLARRVEKKRIQNTYRLGKIVKNMIDAKEITDSGIMKFDSAFPGSTIESNQRDINPEEDAKTLRSLK